MSAKKIINIESIEIDEATAMHGHMLDFKKRGSFIRLGWRKIFGGKVPEYGYHPKHIPMSRKLVETIISSKNLLDKFIDSFLLILSIKLNISFFGN